MMLSRSCRPTKVVALCIVAILITVNLAFAAKNPLNAIPADGYDGKFGRITIQECSEGGNNLASIHSGNFVLYKNCDFDSGVAAFKARIASIRGGSIEVRLDDPTGALMGVCQYDSTGGWQS